MSDTPNPSYVVHTPEAAAEPQNDPMTDEQAIELRALCEETGEPFDTALTRAQADARIEALKEMRG